MNKIINLDNCIIKSADGVELARVYEREDSYYLERTAACTLGIYFFLLGYLRKMGFEVK